MDIKWSLAATLEEKYLKACLQVGCVILLHALGMGKFPNRYPTIRHDSSSAKVNRKINYI